MIPTLLSGRRETKRESLERFVQTAIPKTIPLAGHGRQIWRPSRMLDVISTSSTFNTGLTVSTIENSLVYGS